MVANMDWRGIYVERPAETAMLVEAWRRAAAGETVVAALVAESGFGKTRLAQQFYHWLSTHIDQPEPAGYWPDHLGMEGANLRYNPQIDVTRTALVPPPFLWWGMRLARPNDDRNMHFGSAVSEGKHVLAAQLAHYQRVDALDRIARQRDKAGRDLAIDLGTEAAGAVTFGLAGVLKSVGEYRQQTSQLDAEEAMLNAGEVPPAHADDIVATIIGDLRRVCHAPIAGTAAVPIVMLIDDIQWLPQDRQLSRLLELLINHGIAENWPLLILCTSWEREWRGEDGLGLRTLLRSWGAQPVDVTIGKLALDEVVAMALPGLGPQQRNLVLEKADGNAEFLRLLVNTLLGRPSHFEGHDVAAALSPAGIAYLQDSDRQNIIADRVAQAPAELQRLLALASKQGMRFSPELVARTGAALNLSEAQRWLYRADDPYAFILLAQAQAEFRQRGIWRIASELLEDHFPDQEAVEAAYRSAVAAVAADGASAIETDEIIALDIYSEDDRRVVAAAFAISRIVNKRMSEGEYSLAEQAAFALLDHPRPDRPVACIVQEDHFDALLLPGSRADEWLAWKRHFIDLYAGQLFSNGQLRPAIGTTDIGYVRNLISSALRHGISFTETERLDLGRKAVLLAREMLQRARNTHDTAQAARLLRISLQRLGDALPHGPAKREAIQEQIELLGISSDHVVPEDAVSDRVNTLARLASWHKTNGDRNAALQLRAQCTALWRKLAADRPSAANLARLAQEINRELADRTEGNREADNPEIIALAQEGLQAAERAFHLHPYLPDLGHTIGQLIAKIGARKIAGDASFRAFVRRAEEIMAEKMAALEAGRFAAVDREQGIELGFALGIAYGGTRTRADERRIREWTLRLVRAQTGWWDETRALRNAMICNNYLMHLAFRQGRWRGAVARWRANSAMIDRMNAIFKAHGRSELTMSDLIAIGNGALVSSLRMPPELAGEPPPDLP